MKFSKFFLTTFAFMGILGFIILKSGKEFTPDTQKLSYEEAKELAKLIP